MADILSLKESALVYLDRSGGLKKLAKDCKQVNGAQCLLLNLVAMKANLAEIHLS